MAVIVWTRVMAIAAAALLAGCAGLTPIVAPRPSALPPPVAQIPPPSASATCDAPAFDAAARVNAASLNTSAWMFSAGTAEKPEGPGWALYVPAIVRTLATPCAPTSAGFAQALSQWQARNGVEPDGLMSRDTAAKFKEGWQARRAHLTRPCIELQKPGAAPIPADARYDNADRRLAADALRDYLMMRAAARAALPELFRTPGMLTAASAWRDPVDDRQSCTRNPGPCNGAAKATTCSAHWSGRAVDVNLGFLPGGNPTDSTYANRLHQSQSALYGWMLDNAGRFGFVNYYYEPWHWEWQGDTPAPANPGAAP